MNSPDAPRPPDALLDVVRADLRPVRPRIVPWRRALAWIPAATAVVIALPALVGLRSDASVLGPIVTWGLSTAQLALAAVLIWMAAREAVPGRRVAISAARLAAGVTLLVVLALTLTTFGVSPTVLPDGLTASRAGLFCYRGSVSTAAPLALGAAWLLVAWLPARPWLVGALAGAGAGLAADAGWRLVCPVSDPSHVLAGHAPGILTVAIAGAVVAELAAAVRRRR